MNFDSFSSTLPSLRMATSTPVSQLPSPSSSSFTPPSSSSSHSFSPHSVVVNSDGKNTLWQGDLDPWMDEAYVKQMWLNLGESVHVKMIRDKFTGMNAGYCFVEFSSANSAINALHMYNGSPISGTNKLFKLNWASGGGINDKKYSVIIHHIIPPPILVLSTNIRDQGPEFSIFVGDLGPEVDDDILSDTFQARYSSCKTAKVVTDAVTGLSRGYGFVRFTDENDQQSAMVEMQGQFCGSRPMRISVATPKNRFGNYAYWNSFISSNWNSVGGNNFCTSDPSNTTVFVGGLTNNYVSEEELASYFASFGPITYVKIPLGKGCGFVSFVHRQSAEQAILQLNGSLIGGNRVRLSWGRNSSSGVTSPTLGSASWKPQQLSGSTPLYCLGSTCDSSSINSPNSPDKPLSLSAFNSSIFTTNNNHRSLFGNSSNNNNNSINANNAANNNHHHSLSMNHILDGPLGTGGGGGGHYEVDYVWKTDFMLEPISRPTSAFSLTSPFSTNSLPFRSMNNGYGSAPNSPLIERLSSTPSPNSSYTPSTTK